MVVAAVVVVEGWDWDWERERWRKSSRESCDRGSVGTEGLTVSCDRGGLVVSCDRGRWAVSCDRGRLVARLVVSCDVGLMGESLEVGRRRGDGSGRRMLLRSAVREESWDLAWVGL